MNKLEEILRRAAVEPDLRQEFYEVLLSATIYVLGETKAQEAAEGQSSEKAANKLSIKSWHEPGGSQVIPFFTSVEVLEQSVESGQSVLAMSARSLFEMTLGMTLSLNPKSDYGKEFIPEEVENLLRFSFIDDDTSRE